MITIQQTVDIPANRHLSLDLPKTVPSGRASVVLVFDTPVKAPPVKSAGTVSKTALNSAGNEAVERILSYQFPTLEELKAEAARKAAKREAYIKATGKDPIMELRGSFKGSPFEGIDGVEYQRMMRDEWPD